MKRKIKDAEISAEFELVFSATGSVSLIDISDSATASLIWSSDDDQDFAEEFDGDFFDAKDAEEIIEYLEDAELIDADSILDLVEEDEDGEEDVIEEDDDNVIDADFTPVARPRKRKPS